MGTRAAWRAGEQGSRRSAEVRRSGCRRQAASAGAKLSVPAGEALPALIAARAAFAVIAVMFVIFSVVSVTSALKRKPDHLGDLVARAVGATIVFSIPLAVAFPVGIVASAFLIGVGTPPLTYIFIAFAALVSFRAAVRHSTYGMEGCTKVFGLIWSGYAIIWSVVSFQTTGGFQSIDAEAASLRWLQPPLAALPFALTVLRISNKKKRNLWTFLSFWAFVGATMALCFFPVERGFASAVLPQNDWLRFPLVGLAIVALLTLVRLAFYLRAKPNIRRSRMRDLRTNARMFALIFVVMGLCWAASRAIVGALV